jgi:hypothetical protein
MSLAWKRVTASGWVAQYFERGDGMGGCLGSLCLRRFECERVMRRV